MSQFHFTPLSDVVLKCVHQLNVQEEDSATTERIDKYLQMEFPNMEPPSRDVLELCLNALVVERKLLLDSRAGVYTPAHPINTVEGFENLTISSSAKNDQDTELGSVLDHCSSISDNSKDNHSPLVSLDQFRGNLEEPACRGGGRGGKLVRTNSSVYNESAPLRSPGFQRSKSFKQHAKPSSDSDTVKCNCNAATKSNYSMVPSASSNHLFFFR